MEDGVKWRCGFAPKTKGGGAAGERQESGKGFCVMNDYDMTKSKEE